jgi:hypothetical protein
VWDANLVNAVRIRLAGLQVSFQMSPTMAFQSSIEGKMGRCDLTDEARRDRSRTNWAVCETLLIPVSAKRQYCHVRESCHADEPGPPFHYRSGEKRDQMWDDRVRASASGRMQTQTSAKDDMRCSQSRSSSNLSKHRSRSGEKQLDDSKFWIDMNGANRIEAQFEKDALNFQNMQGRANGT